MDAWRGAGHGPAMGGLPQNVGPPPPKGNPAAARVLLGADRPFGQPQKRMADLSEVVSWCDARVRTADFKDFPGAHNGLQVANGGEITRVGAAVDAGLAAFEMARERGIDFVIVHHGLLWESAQRVTGRHHRKLKLLLDSGIAVYSSHLPLDGHPQIGNNALLAKMLGLEIEDWPFRHEGQPVGCVARLPYPRADLAEALRGRFPHVTAMEFGPEAPERVGIVSGGGGAYVGELRKLGLDTYVTGELAQHHFNFAQEEGLNLYCGGHYATETFGVCALAAEVAERFGLTWEFLDTGCPL